MRNKDLMRLYYLSKGEDINFYLSNLEVVKEKKEKKERVFKSSKSYI